MNPVPTLVRLCVITCTAALLFTAAPEAAAQGGPVATVAPARISVFGSVGYNGQWDDESRLGQSVAVSGGVGYRITSRLSVEGLVNRLEHRRDLLFYSVSHDAADNPTATPAPATLTGSATYLLGQVRYVFSTSRVQPYVAGAIGVMHYSGNGWAAVFPPVLGQPTTPSGVSVTTPAIGGTGGVDVVVNRRVTIGPYFGLLMSNNDEAGTKNALHGGVRIGLGW
jgi:hypothetical protein